MNHDQKVLSVVNLTKIYPTSFRGDSLLRVVDDLSFDLFPGQAYGLIGPNGAGKTTTVKMIVGLTPADEGEIKIFGQPNSDLKIKQKIGYMPENPTFYAHLTAHEFLLFVGNLFNIPNNVLEERIPKILESVGLAEAAFRGIKGFSKGMKQRLGLAQAIINEPDILILDEPLDGLDPMGRSDIKDSLLKMKEDGKTILLSSHILSDVEEICDRILIINKGQTVKEGEVKSIIPQDSTLEDYFVKVIKEHNK